MCRGLRWCFELAFGGLLAAEMLGIVLVAFWMRGSSGSSEKGEWGLFQIPSALSSWWRGGAAAKLAEEETFQQLQKKTEALDASLDRLEARFYSSHASVFLWSELAVRHRQISEVACRNLEEHAQELIAHDRRERKRAALIHKKKRKQKEMETKAPP